MGEVGECGVYLVAVIVPVAVAAGVEAARWRGAGESKLLHSPLDRSSLGEGFVSRDGREHDEAHGLVGAEGGTKGVLPDTVAARDDDRKDRTAETSRKVEGSRLKCDFDAQDRALGKEEDAFSGLDGSAGAAKKGAGGRDRALGPDEEVPPAREMAAENRERGELVPGDSGEREG